MPYLDVNCHIRTMTLHAAIEKLLLQHGRPMTTSQIASELNKNNWYQKKDGSEITAFQIHGRTRNYANLFDRDGSTVYLANKSQKRFPKQTPNDKSTTHRKQPNTKDSDESYVIDLCDQILGTSASRQHKFEFLRGDINSQGNSVRLPVDAYYEKLNLVVEYREKQHSEEVRFFDKPNKMTISGVNRAEQRRIYDQRRRDILPEHGIQLVEISYADFNHNNQKRIIRNNKNDLIVIKSKLKITAGNRR